MRTKILIWTGAAILVCAMSLTVYWYTEPDVWIQPHKVIIANQLEGDSITLDVPVQNYAQVLPEFQLRTQIKTYGGKVIKESDTIDYDPDMRYKFVTYKLLTEGRYEARAIVGYQLNPLAYRELDFPLAIIYVRKQDDNNRSTEEVRGP
jgi:hypothetical protein